MTRTIILALGLLTLLAIYGELSRMNDILEADSNDCLAAPEEAQLAGL